MQKGELREQRFHTGTVELNDAEGPASGEALLYLHGGDGRWQEGRALLEALASALVWICEDMVSPGTFLEPIACRIASPMWRPRCEQVVNRPTVLLAN